VLLNVPGSPDSNKTYEMKNNSNIAWASDRDLYGPSQYNWDDVVVPPNWVERYPNNYSDDYHPDLVNDEAFQVWMRLAGLPTFSKLYQRNDDEEMQSGTYSVTIDHRKFFHGYSLTFFAYLSRLQRNRIRRDKIHHHIYKHCGRR